MSIKKPRHARVHVRQLTLLLSILVIMLAGTALANPQVLINARLDPPFVIERISVWNLSTSVLTFNVSSLQVEYAVATAEGLTCEGSLVNASLLRFKFEKPVGNISVVLVLRLPYSDWKNYNLTIRAPLCPLEAARCNSTFVLAGLPSSPRISRSTFKATSGRREDLGHYVRGGLVARAGEVGEVSFSLDRFRYSPEVVELHRTIVIDESGVTVVDNYTLRGLAAFANGTLVLTYPARLTLRGVRGLISAYPPANYAVVSAANATRITITLIAPPYGEGDKTYVSLTLSLATELAGARYEIPAFMGVKRYVPNLQLYVKVRGRASIDGLTVVRSWEEDGYRVYYLGAFKLPPEGGPRPTVAISVQLTPDYRIALLVAAVAIPLLAVTATLKLRRRVPEAAAKEVVVQKEIVTLLQRRLENLRELVSVWKRYVAGKLSNQAYRQAASRIRSQESSLMKKCSEAAARETLDVKRSLEELERLAVRLWSSISEAESIQRRIARGHIPRREREKLLRETEKKVDRLLTEIEGVVEKLMEILK